MLKRRIENLEDVEEAYRGLYEEAEDGDGYVLTGVEQDPDSAKVKQMRQNNISLNKKVEELNEQVKQFQGIDPEKYREGMDALNKLKNLDTKKLLEQGKLDEVIEQKTTEMREHFQSQIEQLTEARDTEANQRKSLLEQLSSTKIRSELLNAINELASLKTGALDDALARTERNWSLSDEGKLVPSDTLVDTQGDKITTMKQWVKHLLKTAPHLFDAGGGGGAAGGGGRPPRTGEPRVIKQGSRLKKKDLEEMAEGKAVMETSAGG